MKIIKRSKASLYKPSGLIAISLAVMLATGCATADQRMASKADYRDSQIEAIKVQAEAETARQTNHALAQQQMWQSMAEVVKSNPDSASHFAIVMAVAAARGAAEPGDSPAAATLKTERDTTALDYVKVIAPALINTVGTVGAGAIAAETIRNASDNAREVNLERIRTDGQMWDVLGDAVNGDDDTVATTDVTEDVVDTMDETPADDVVDPSEDIVEPDEDVEEEETVDCTPPLFSPVPPECAS